MEEVGDPETVGLAKSERVAQALAREIRAGRVTRGDQLDSEGALMRRFDVSRNTVRRGLQILAGQGLITTRTGIGSFVTYRGDTIDDRKGWSVALSHGPDRLETRLLRLNRGGCARADTFLAARGLDTAGDYLCIDRLRVSPDTGQGVSLERSRLPWRAVFADVPSDGLADGSLSRTLAALGLVATTGEEVAGVLPALPAADAGVMKRPAETPMLRLQRLTRAADGTLLEHVESVLDPDRFGLRMVF
ncbi:GntR family transcriptional regulator [Oceaniglobus indicus]|uniref:GntR family transcriptional regulator n=1 Tax=Oceaniglobus indicus TaxID=2047749 RepID=UPI000C19507A|nr:GntR family transcriptional regulator [Oceaniglobus indicus]